MRIGLVMAAVVLLVIPSAGQSKVIAEGEYGRRSGEKVQKIENGSGLWTVTATSDGNFEFHHKVGNSEQSFSFDKHGVPVSSRLSGPSLTITCELGRPNVTCQVNGGKETATLKIEKPYVFMPALRGSDIILMMTGLAAAVEKTPGKITEVAEIEFQDRSDEKLALESTESEKVMFVGRRKCSTPIGTVSCNVMKMDEMVIEVADSGLLLRIGSGTETTMELISIKDESHQLLHPIGSSTHASQ